MNFSISFQGYSWWQKFLLIRALDTLLLLGLWFTVYGLEHFSRSGQSVDLLELFAGAIVLASALEIRPAKDPLKKGWQKIKDWC